MSPFGGRPCPGGVIDSIRVSEAGIEQASPWWLKGGAIFIGVLGLASLLNALILGVTGIVMGGVVAEIDPEEICAEDDDREACEGLIEELVSLGDSRVWDVGAASSALLFLLSIPTALLMWSSDDRDTALKLAWGWVGIHAISQLYATHVLVSWTSDFYTEMPSDGVDLGFISLFNQVASYAGVLMCELTLVAGLVLISYKTRPLTKIEMPSAFHTSEE